MAETTSWASPRAPFKTRACKVTRANVERTVFGFRWAVIVLPRSSSAPIPALNWRGRQRTPSRYSVTITKPTGSGLLPITPRLFKGTRMAGHLGNVRSTVLNLQVVDVIPDRNLVLVRGAVPGAKKGIIVLRKAVKGRK